MQSTVPLIGASKKQITPNRGQYASIREIWNPQTPTIPGQHGAMLFSRTEVDQQRIELFYQPLRANGGRSWIHLGTYDANMSFKKDEEDWKGFPESVGKAGMLSLSCPTIGCSF